MYTTLRFILVAAALSLATACDGIWETDNPPGGGVAGIWETDNPPRR